MVNFAKLYIADNSICFYEATPLTPFQALPKMRQ